MGSATSASTSRQSTPADSPVSEKGPRRLVLVGTPFAERESMGVLLTPLLMSMGVRPLLRLSSVDVVKFDSILPPLCSFCLRYLNLLIKSLISVCLWLFALQSFHVEITFESAACTDRNDNHGLQQHQVKQDQIGSKKELRAKTNAAHFHSLGASG